MAKACMNMPIQQTATPASQSTVQMDRPMERGAVDREKMLMQASSQGPGQFQPEGVVGREQGRVYILDPQKIHASNTTVIGTIFIDKL